MRTARLGRLLFVVVEPRELRERLHAAVARHLRHDLRPQVHHDRARRGGTGSPRPTDSLGQDMVRAHVERAGKSPAARWAAMEHVISEPTTPADLVR